MREILFRGKRTDNDEWAFGFFTKSPSGNVYITETVTGCASPKTVDPDTVGQFTGLTDKNGKKIFEGDILKEEIRTRPAKDGSPRYKTRKYVVCCDAWAFHLEAIGATGRPSRSVSHCYVIGNIHDNPELLGGAEDGK